jgi:hypothetical protein
MITMLRTIFLTAATAFVLTASAAVAQTQPQAAPSSVLPSGGGQALRGDPRHRGYDECWSDLASCLTSER